MKNDKKPVGKIILAVVLVIVIGIGVYGTVIGLKDTIEHKRKVDKYLNNETTEALQLSEKTKEFSCDGFSITLTEDFWDVEDSDSSLTCATDGIEVIVYGDEFDGNSKEFKMTADEYLKSLIDSDDGSVIFKEIDGKLCAKYAFIGEGNGIFKEYQVFCYKGKSTFWMVHFITEEDYTDRCASYISEWIKTVEVE